MENLNELLSKYQHIVKKIKANEFIFYLISWDSQTEAPVGCFEERAKQMEFLSGEHYRFLTSEDTVNTIDQLYSKRDELDEVLKHEITELKKSNDKTKKIPIDEYTELTSVLAVSENIWAQAKENNDFSLFAPYLKKIIELQKKYIKHLETENLKGYNVLLDEYEPGI